MNIPNNYFRFEKTHNISMGSLADYRSEYDRDYSRILHCPSFRRLQNKTQLFPLIESDYFRNRLTHSLEVAQIAKLIAKKLKAENSEKNIDISPEVCEIAGMAHDIGHPPFGHNGEKALNDCMHMYGGFEGNAQTLRILTRLEKKEYLNEKKIESKGIDCDKRTGLNLTARVLASIIKYDKVIPQKVKSSKLVKGYYASEREIVNTIKKQLLGKNYSIHKNFKTIECSIMDIADDIAYSTYDLEDIFKSGFLTPYDIISASDDIYKKISYKINKDFRNLKVDYFDCRNQMIGILFDMINKPIELQYSVERDEFFEVNTLQNFNMSYKMSKDIAQNGYYRTNLTSVLVNSFINGVEIDVNNRSPILYQAKFNDETLLRVNVLKYFTYYTITNSSLLRLPENFGYDIINKIFNKLISEGGDKFLPYDIQKIYLKSKLKNTRMRIICDYIAGMTDRYAIEYYSRMFLPNSQTIFKPL